MNKRLILRLTGELKTSGAGWDNSEFGELFLKLENKVPKTSPLFRFVRLCGNTETGMVLNFFGIESDGTDHIPERMVCLELFEDSITVVSSSVNSGRDIRQGRLDWDWLDTSVPNRPLGECTVQIPDLDSRGIHLSISGFSYGTGGKAANDTVELVDYDPSWPERFGKVKTWLKGLLPDGFTQRIEHYGSTSIPGMPAKPVIDILLEVPSFGEARRVLLPLFNKPESEYWWYNDHMTFIIRDGFLGTRTHHIHAAPEGHTIWEGLAFRDFLRNHPEDAKRYAELKYKLAKNHTSDRETYTNLKYEFVREITEKALNTETANE